MGSRTSQGSRAASQDRDCRRVGRQSRSQPGVERVAGDPGDAASPASRSRPGARRSRSPARSSRAPPTRSGRSRALARDRGDRARAARVPMPAAAMLRVDEKVLEPQARGGARNVEKVVEKQGKSDRNSPSTLGDQHFGSRRAGRTAPRRRSCSVETHRCASFSYSASARIIAAIAGTSPRRRRADGQPGGHVAVAAGAGRGSRGRARRRRARRPPAACPQRSKPARGEKRERGGVVAEDEREERRDSQGAGACVDRVVEQRSREARVAARRAACRRRARRSRGRPAARRTSAATATPATSLAARTQTHSGRRAGSNSRNHGFALRDGHRLGVGRRHAAGDRRVVDRDDRGQISGLRVANRHDWRICNNFGPASVSNATGFVARPRRPRVHSVARVRAEGVRPQRATTFNLGVSNGIPAQEGCVGARLSGGRGQRGRC